MFEFPIHTLDDAPEGSRASLKALQSAFGFIPAMAGAMATSPVLISSLVVLFGKVHGGSFTERQIQVLLLTNAVTNRSEWAVAFHSALALQQGIDRIDVDTIRSGSVPQDPEIAVLSHATRGLIEKRGQLDEIACAALRKAGFGPAHVLEMIAICAASTMTNYTATLAKPPVEAAFAEYVWRAA